MTHGLLPRSIAILIAIDPGPPDESATSNRKPAVIGLSWFEAEQHSPDLFTYSLHVHTTGAREGALPLAEQLKPPVFKPKTVIGFGVPEIWDGLRLMAQSAPSVGSFLESLGAARQTIDLASDSAVTFAETCAAAGIDSCSMTQDEVIEKWRTGRDVELFAMLATNVVACWRLWAARERPGDEVPHRFAQEAFAAWRTGDQRTHAWRNGQGVLPEPSGRAREMRRDALELYPADLQPLPVAIPTTAYIRPCEVIAPEQTSGFDSGNSLADRYSALTQNLPLAGAKAMRTNAAGDIRLIARLRATAPWLEPAIEKIDQTLRVQNWAGRPWLAWRPLLLSGPPGIGKSYLARAIGELARTGHAILDLGGVSDNRTLEGTARGWTNAQPCWPAVVMSQTRTANPVLLLEEVEKAGGSERNGAPHGTLLVMIEAETAKTYWDKCLLANVDLSHCCWLMTANDADLLPAPLRSRIDIVEVKGPGPEHFDHIVAAVIGDLASVWRVPVHLIPDLPERAHRLLRQAFTKHRSVRRLRRYLEQLISTMVGDDQRRLH